MKSFLAFCLLLVAFAANAQDSLTIIRAGKLFDSRTGTVKEKQLILIIGGVIVDIQTEEGKWKPTTNVKIIDLSDKFVMPGMMDAHVHFFLHPYNEASWDDQVTKETLALRTLRAGAQAKATLMAGFTTVRDLGTEGALYADVSLREAIEKGIVAGPRYYCATKAIVITGGYGPKGYAQDVPQGAEEVSGVDDMRRVVRDQIGHGADWIKLYGDYGRKDGETQTTFTVEEIQTAVQEAKAVGMFVSVHAYTPEAIKRAAQAGVKSIEHGTNSDEITFVLMSQRGVAWVPTLAALEAIGSYAPADKQEQYKKRLEEQKKIFQTGLKSGVNIVCGSDAGVFTHGNNAREIELMVEYGMTTTAALQSATIKAAELIDPSKKLGSIEKGYLADIIAVDGNPIQRINDLRKVFFVMKNGVVYK